MSIQLLLATWLDSSGKQAYKIVCKQSPSIVVKCMNFFLNRKIYNKFHKYFISKEKMNAKYPNFKQRTRAMFWFVNKQTFPWVGAQ
jgi:hypothetical protein